MKHAARPWPRRAAAALALSAALLAPGPGVGAEAPSYDVLFDATLKPAQRAMAVSIRVSQQGGTLRSLAFRIDPERQLDWAGDGQVERREDVVAWEVPEAGGTLRYLFSVDALRGDNTYDARAAAEWAIFRGDDLVPPATARAVKGAHSRARLRLRLPEGWSAAVPFPPARGGTWKVESAHRLFDRPTGWILLGKRLGVVRETVAGTKLAIAGPAGSDVRRLDMLALFRWTLPELRKVLPAPPERLLVVSAGDPMWRGGLSGPNSVFIHADRPLITPDGTSPLLHEALHTAFPHGAVTHEDWLVEGLAEYYAVELLVRSRTVSRARHEKALARLAERGRSVGRVRVADASGAVTARAVTLLTELDRILSEATGQEHGLDGAVRRLMSDGAPLALDTLRAAAEAEAGRPLGDFFDRAVFGPPAAP